MALRRKVTQISVKKRIMVTLAGIFVVAAVAVGCLTYWMQSSRLKASLSDMPNTESRLFDAILSGDAEGLSRAAAGLSRVDFLLKPFAAGNRDLLLGEAAPLFADLKAHHNITHMYFIKPDGTVFLRVHKPEQAGDRLQRVTYLKASQTGQTAYGIEMGKNFFSLRCVRPVTVAGAPAGYVEVAEEIDHFFPRMKAITGNDVTIFLTDDFLNRTGAEVKKAHVAGGFTLLYSSDESLGAALASAGKVRIADGVKTPLFAVVDYRGATYAVSASPLRDAAGDPVGIIFSHRNVTPLFAPLLRGALVTTFFSCLVLAAAFLFIYLALRDPLQRFNIIRRHIMELTTGWDLSRRLRMEEPDEVGNLGREVDMMTEKLSDTVSRLQGSGAELDTVAGNIRHATLQMVRSAEMQSENEEGTAAAVSRITDSVNVVYDSIRSLGVSSEETSASLHQMTVSVGETSTNMENLSVSVEEVSSSISEMAASVRQIGASVRSLLDASTATATSVDLMDTTIRQVEKRTAETATIATALLADAEKGQLSVEAAIQGIHAIRHSAGITTQAMTTLSTKAESIGTILSVIDDITEQTNLLALNASIIAAQAGEHGKGFAVVAGEIKQLAERTRVSTREIAEVIKGLQSETKRAAAALHDAEESIVQGERLSAQSGEALVKIVVGVQQSALQAEEIAKAMQEQAGGSDLIRNAIAQVTDLVQQIVQANREQGGAAELIIKAAENMRNLASRVLIATREQNAASHQVSTATQSINDRIRDIDAACAQQQHDGKEIIALLETGSESTLENLRCSRLLEESLDLLGRQILFLHGEMSRFSTSAAAENRVQPASSEEKSFPFTSAS